MHNVGSAYHTTCLLLHPCCLLPHFPLPHFPLLHFPPLHFWPYRIFHFSIFSRPSRSPDRHSQQRNIKFLATSLGINVNMIIIIISYIARQAAMWIGFNPHTHGNSHGKSPHQRQPCHTVRRWVWLSYLHVINRISGLSAVYDACAR